MPRWIYEKSELGCGENPQGIPVSILNMLRRRAVVSAEQIEDFLSPAPRATYDPALLPDLQEAAVEIVDTADAGGLICVYGDYDADGVTSSAMMYSVLKKLSPNVRFYLPSRFEDGYGLNMESVEDMASEGTRLLITVDCGSTNLAEVRRARELGIKVIVTDHHEPGEEGMSDCLFINPKRKDSNYPFKELSGCGTAFKLLQGIQRLLAERGDERFTKQDLNDQLDLVAISTVADVVPLLDENRTLVKYGLHVLNSLRRPGLKILADMLGLVGGRISSEDIAYNIAPHINSLGRMSRADSAVELLAGEGSDEELREKASEMIETNRQRRRTQDETAEICLELAKSEHYGDLFPIIKAPEAHEGVAGIVAGKLKESLYRPVCIVTESAEGLLKGTSRSIPELNIHDMLSSCSDLFVRFGGHSGACGFSMDPANLEELRERSEAFMRRELEARPELLQEIIYIEDVLQAGDISEDFVGWLKKLEPYGKDNERPIFAIENVHPGGIYRMGSEGQHLRFIITKQDRRLQCVLFSRAEQFLDLMLSDLPLDLAGELGIDEYNGKRNLQFTVRDIKRSELND
ncbi:MAG: single-stranded-DNA-specific exonuclease RecJ [Clostridiales bacterium]|nr:single-stranded-DNA-specific exonuclease RecJ [Clostridiales bacterium]